jgi:hypothetical protein
MSEVAVVPEVNVTGVIAVIVKSDRVKVANVNVRVVLCMIPLEVPVTVTAYVPTTLELQESVAVPKPCGIVGGSMALQVISDGRGRSERVTVPVKSLTGFTTIVEVPGVVPSAGTILGRVAPTVKSGRRIELNAQGDDACDSELCGANIGWTFKLNTNSSNRVCLLNGRQLGEFPNGLDKLRPRDSNNLALQFFQ